jgi:hypothetical protein
MIELVTLNMCDFCSLETETCGAIQVSAKELNTSQGNIMAPDSVLACEKYESPVEALKKKFH